MFCLWKSAQVRSQEGNVSRTYAEQINFHCCLFYFKAESETEYNAHHSVEIKTLLEEKKNSVNPQAHITYNISSRIIDNTSCFIQ